MRQCAHLPTRLLERRRPHVLLHPLRAPPGRTCCRSSRGRGCSHAFLLSLYLPLSPPILQSRCVHALLLRVASDGLGLPLLPANLGESRRISAYPAPQVREAERRQVGAARREVVAGRLQLQPVRERQTGDTPRL